LRKLTGGAGGSEACHIGKRNGRKEQHEDRAGLHNVGGCWQEGALCGDGFRAYESKPRPNCPVRFVCGQCAGLVCSLASRG